jgi:hypothetical protein
MNTEEMVYVREGMLRQIERLEHIAKDAPNRDKLQTIINSHKKSVEKIEAQLKEMHVIPTYQSVRIVEC